MGAVMEKFILLDKISLDFFEKMGKNREKFFKIMLDCRVLLWYEQSNNRSFRGILPNWSNQNCEDGNIEIGLIDFKLGQFFQKPVLFGPHMFNFHDISKLFLSERAGKLVRDQEDLLKKTSFLLSNPVKLRAIGKKARRLVLNNQGATQRNVKAISKIINHG